MKYIKKREFFTSNIDISNINIREQIKSSQMISEVFENDIRWGDSLLGRLVNSTLRVGKAKYNTTKIPNLLKDLEDQFNVLVSESFTKETYEKFNLYVIKNELRQIKDVCLNTTSDVDKLIELLGWDGHTAMWDPSDPKNDIPNFVKDGKLITDGSIVQHAIDIITHNLPGLEKIIGQNRNELLDTLSNFAVALRQLTITDDTQVGSNKTTQSSFVLNFKTLLTHLSSVTENNKFIVSYAKFILEDYIPYEEVEPKKTTKPSLALNGTKNINIKALKTLGVEVLQAIKDDITEDELKKSDIFKKFKYDFNHLEEHDITKLSLVKIPEQKTDLYHSLFNILKDENVSGTNNDIIDTQAEEVPNKEKTDVKNKTEYIPKHKELGTKQIVNKSDDIIDTQAEEIHSKDLDSNKSKTEYIPNRKELSESYKFYESAHISPGGTASNTNDVGDGDDNDAKKKTVSDIWEKFWGESDRKSPHDMTQRETAELFKLIKNNSNNLIFDLSKKRPDPLIGIVRLFSRAHDLYYTPVIPSGRIGGKVSQKTFREYESLDNSRLGSADRPSDGGPYVLKSVWSAWTEGVTKIIQDQKYRKVLANIKFVVLGSEDIDSPKKESIKIFEDTTTPDDNNKQKKSHGQILLEFINDLLSKKTAADFTEARRKLLAQYFGLPDKNTDSNAPKPNRLPNKIDVDPRSASWIPLSSQQFNKATHVGTLYAMPVADQRKTKKEPVSMIFFQILKIDQINKFVHIKFTFGTQALALKYLEETHKGYTITNDPTNGATSNNVYYGIFINEHIDKGLKLVYVNITNGDTKIKEENIHGEPIKPKQLNFKYQPVPTLKYNSNLVIYNEHTQIQKITLKQLTLKSETLNNMISSIKITDGTNESDIEDVLMKKWNLYF